MFLLGKWDLGHWDWDSQPENGNGKHVSTRKKHIFQAQ